MIPNEIQLSNSRTPMVGPQIERKSGVGAPTSTVRSTVTPVGARVTGKGAPTPPVPASQRRFGAPK